MMMHNLKKYLIATAIAAYLPAAPAVEWQLVWQDEFTQSIGPDWVFETTNNNGWGNAEKEYYQAANATIDNGQLVITARREDVADSHYTSARLKTQGRLSFRYGRVEARIKMPAQQGIWPAFWMLGSNINEAQWPACGEIDIMEHINTENRTYGTIHWQDDSGNHAEYGGNTPISVTDYHVYAIEWDEQAIRWYVDGNQYHEVDIHNNTGSTEEFHRDFFLLLNMAVGGNWPGQQVDDAALPARMYVDYVRVYKPVADSGFSLTTQAESYSSMSGVDTEQTSDSGGGLDVGWIDNSDWLAYSNIRIPETGDYRVEYRVASPDGGGQISLDLNAGSQVLGYLDIPATGDWQNWTTVSHTVHINAGTYDVGIYAQLGGFNLNWWRITKL